jgi:hypothetical protein
MRRKQRFFLLDAGPVIALHSLGLWNEVTRRCELVVPRVIAVAETLFWKSETGERVPIHIVADAAAGRLELLDTEPADLRDTLLRFDRATQESVDPGELHAPTQLRLWVGEDKPRFCSSDRMDVICLCLLGLSDLAISLEELLIDIGLGRGVEWKHSSAAIKQWVQDGRRRHVTGQGLASTP